MLERADDTTVVTASVSLGLGADYTAVRTRVPQTAAQNDAFDKAKLTATT